MQQAKAIRVCSRKPSYPHKVSFLGPVPIPQRSHVMSVHTSTCKRTAHKLERWHSEHAAAPLPSFLDVRQQPVNNPLEHIRNSFMVSCPAWLSAIWSRFQRHGNHPHLRSERRCGQAEYVLSFPACTSHHSRRSTLRMRPESISGLQIYQSPYAALRCTSAPVRQAGIENVM